MSRPKPRFLTTPRRLPARRPVDERLADWRELDSPRPTAEAEAQGGRCVGCGVPFCHQGCPLGNLIPDWNTLLAEGKWQEAYRRLAATNNFPELTGRLCPAPCEPACTVAIHLDAVTIEQNEKEIIEHAFAEGWVVPRPPRTRTGRRVAVVGSGPAGLAAAAQLNAVGHLVVVYEAADRVGGLLRYGIPDYKLERRLLDRRLALLEAEGIEFRTGAQVGVDPTWSEVQERHDAVLLAMGSRRPRDLVVPGRDLTGVYPAMELLERQNRRNAGDADLPAEPDARGRHVVILGGGDTGADCLGTALRQGAASVTQVELLPRPPDARLPTNPWPQWPRIHRTASAHEEGGTREFGVLTKSLAGEGGRLTALHAVRVREATPGAGPAGLEEIPGTELVLPVDLLLLAMGFVGVDPAGLEAALGLRPDPRGNLGTDARFATGVPGVYCAGDAHRGQSLIVHAISEGREAARAIDEDLRGGPSPLPTRGRDTPF